MSSDGSEPDEFAAHQQQLDRATRALAGDLYADAARTYLHELLQNADDNEYDRLPGTVCGVGGSDGREASDLAPSSRGRAHWAPFPCTRTRATQAAALPKLQEPEPGPIDSSLAPATGEVMPEEAEWTTVVRRGHRAKQPPRHRGGAAGGP